MHIPDGFLGPQTYGPACGMAGVLWAVGLRRLRRTLDPAAVPRLAVTTAAAFVLMLVTVPLPGGTTVHLTGIGMIAVLFGVWRGFLAISLVYLLQAFMFGDGGVTAVPVMALTAGLGGTAAAVTVFRALKRWPRSAVFLAGWSATAVTAALTAAVLGAQPRLASAPDGTPLFFPFGWTVTVPAIVVPHLLVGVADGVLAVLACRALDGKGTP